MKKFMKKDAKTKQTATKEVIYSDIDFSQIPGRPVKKPLRNARADESATVYTTHKDLVTDDESSKKILDQGSVARPARDSKVIDTSPHSEVPEYMNLDQGSFARPARDSKVIDTSPHSEVPEYMNLDQGSFARPARDSKVIDTSPHSEVPEYMNLDQGSFARPARDSKVIDTSPHSEVPEYMNLGEIARQRENEKRAAGYGVAIAEESALQSVIKSSSKGARPKEYSSNPSPVPIRKKPLVSPKPSRRSPDSNTVMADNPVYGTQLHRSNSPKSRELQKPSHTVSDSLGDVYATVKPNSSTKPRFADNKKVVSVDNNTAPAVPPRRYDKNKFTKVVTMHVDKETDGALKKVKKIPNFTQSHMNLISLEDAQEMQRTKSVSNLASDDYIPLTRKEQLSQSREDLASTKKGKKSGFMAAIKSKFAGHAKGEKDRKKDSRSRSKSPSR